MTKHARIGQATPNRAQPNRDCHDENEHAQPQPTNTHQNPTAVSRQISNLP